VFTFVSRTDEFDAFYTSSVRRVIHHVYLVCGNLAEAQDAAQDAYARAWQRWSTIADYDDPEAWVRTVAWRLAANRWRGMRRWLAARIRLGAPPVVPGPTPDRVALMAALRKLSEAQRRVVVLHYLYGLTVAEISATTEMPAGTVKVYLARGRTALAALLSNDEKEDGDVVAHS
jgi:RNA polymerase sigma-70 factor (ECF subfamily)